MPRWGGGLEIALACTFRVCVSQAKLAVPKIRLGLIPVYGATPLLPWLIGPGPALRMLLGGEALDGLKAYSVGLVDHLTDSNDNLLNAACAFAAKDSKYGLPTQQAIRQAVREGNNLLRADGLVLEAGLGRRIGRPTMTRRVSRRSWNGVSRFLKITDPQLIWRSAAIHSWMPMTFRIQA